MDWDLLKKYLVLNHHIQYRYFSSARFVLLTRLSELFNAKSHSFAATAQNVRWAGSAAAAASIINVRRKFRPATTTNTHDIGIALQMRSDNPRGHHQGVRNSRPVALYRTTRRRKRRRRQRSIQHRGGRGAVDTRVADDAGVDGRDGRRPATRRRWQRGGAAAPRRVLRARRPIRSCRRGGRDRSAARITRALVFRLRRAGAEPTVVDVVAANIAPLVARDHHRHRSDILDVGGIFDVDVEQ